MTGFTKGPWKLNSDALIVRANGIAMSIAIAYDKISASDGVSRDEMKANARLIASAPELLEALQAMLKPGDGPRSSDWYAAKAAVKKAIG